MTSQEMEELRNMPETAAKETKEIKETGEFKGFHFLPHE